MPTLDYYLPHAGDDHEKALLISQDKEVGTVTCSCGHRARFYLMYRCLYCGIWFCTRCAEEHFGQTVAEWRAEKAGQPD